MPYDQAKVRFREIDSRDVLPLDASASAPLVLLVQQG